MARIEPKEKTINRLYALSGNQCAFPDCPVRLVSPKNKKNIAAVCHIEAAEPGGARYNPNSNDEERRGFENLILLCQNHHKEVDDLEEYTVDVLKKMKKVHEDKQLQHEKSHKYPSALNTVIKHIGVRIFDNQTEELLNVPNPQEKISYNHVLRFEFIIKEYAVYQGRLNKLYEEIEKQGSTKKEYVLQNIKTIYLEEKGSYRSLEEIRANADNIIDKVKERLWNIIENSSNLISDLEYEVINKSLLIILVDAFMRCDILEGPPKI
jgi:hypothetical protein